MATSCKRLGLELMNWHDSSGDPVYAAGSSLFSGRKIPADLADRVSRKLEGFAFSPKAERRRSGWTAKDVRSLLKMSRALRGKACRL